MAANGTNGAASAEQRVTVVSVDSHVAAQVAAYRPYVDPEFVDRFDEFAKASADFLASNPPAGSPNHKHDFHGTLNPRTERYWNHIQNNYNAPGLYDDASHRLASMDADGITAEVIFHGGFNRLPIPFYSPDLAGTSFGEDLPSSPAAAAQRWAGMRAYNRWLADWTSLAPKRMIGLAMLPIWDVEAAVAEVAHIAELGYHAANFQASRRGLKTYNSPDYDPLWAACVEHDISLHAHVAPGSGIPDIDPSPGAWSVFMAEMAHASRRHLWQMIFGAVFERFPALQISLTEQTGRWVGYTLDTLDSVYYSSAQDQVPVDIMELLPRRPSEYFRTNAFVGASFMSRDEAQEAIDRDFWSRMMWGRDYPHPEGTWPFTRESMRSTFAGFEREHVEAMLGRNAIRFLGLDAAALDAVAQDIGPTFAEVDTPLEALPETNYLSMGFRRYGAYA